MWQTGTTAIVYDDPLQPSVKIKQFRSAISKESMDHEVRMLRRAPPNICAALLHYEYPHLQLQRMDESLESFICRKQPSIEVLADIIDAVARKCMVFYASGMFHCDLMVKNVMLLYRTPQSDPLDFLIDLGISMIRNERLDALPRTPDSRDNEYDFCFFLYSCLCFCTYIFDDLYRHLSSFIPTIRRYFEKYHNNAQNHQWYLVGTLYKDLGWQITLAGS